MSVATPMPQSPAPCPASATDRSERPESGRLDQRQHLPLRPWLLCVCVLPFLSVPLAHVLSAPETATGLFHYELPYYLANGRAAFERGNGLLYPNPYDPANDAPVIYFHWLPEMAGFATAVLGADPGTFMLWLTLGAAVALAAVTRRLIVTCLPCSESESAVALLLVMWGGGLLVIGGALAGLMSGRLDLLQLDPGNGLWFLNWGRNALFPTEAIYHTLTACCWLLEIRKRHHAASLVMFLLATTHPWSGLELLLTINLWRFVRLLQLRQRQQAVQLTVSATILGGFLLYYRVWLPSFEQHAALQRVWELDWSLSWTSAVLAWGLMGTLAARRLWRDPESLRTPEVRFLLCVLVVAGGLSLHDRLMPPVQPLHFTRGYVWIPLCLLGLPLLLESVRRHWRASAKSRGLLCLLGLILVSDNLVFGLVHCGRQWQQQDGFHLHVHDRVLLADLHEKFPPSVVLTDSAELNYLLPAWASQRPWLGHRFNTPDFPERQSQMRRCFADNSVSPDEIPPDVTLLVIRLSRDSQPLGDSDDWQYCSVSNASWAIWIRIPADN